MKKFLALLLVVLTSCSYFSQRKSERVLARVYDDYLYESDLTDVLTPGLSPTDSMAMARNFIDSWVRQRLLLKQAENNLSKEQMDFTKQLENYKNSLVIYEYEDALVKQKLDTIVSDEEIENYYIANQANFLLKENIVQVRYVKLPKSVSNVKQIKGLLVSGKSEDKTKLSELAERYAADYFLDDENWLLFSDVMNQIPIKTYNQEEFLKNHKDVEVQDSSFVYIALFKDFKIKESVSPLSYEKDRVRNIILNKRKLELIGKMQQEVYDKAVKKSDFEIY